MIHENGLNYIFVYIDKNDVKHFVDGRWLLMTNSYVPGVVQNPFKNGLQMAPWWHLNHIPRTSTKFCEIIYTTHRQIITSS